MNFTGLLLGPCLPVRASDWACTPSLSASAHETSPSIDSSGARCVTRLDVNLPVPETGRELAVP